MKHLFQGEWADVKAAARTPWVPAAWLACVIWATWLLPVPASLHACFLALFLTLLLAVDIKTFTLPNLLTYPMAALGFLLAPDKPMAILGFFTAYAVFWAVKAGSLKLLKKEGLGQGDVKLFAALGTWVGVTGLPLVALTASLTALAYILVARHPKRALLPFGPFLAVGGWVVYLYQGWIWQTLARITHHAPPF